MLRVSAPARSVQTQLCKYLSTLASNKWICKQEKGEGQDNIVGVYAQLQMGANAP